MGEPACLQRRRRLDRTCGAGFDVSSRYLSWVVRSVPGGALFSSPVRWSASRSGGWGTDADRLAVALPACLARGQRGAGRCWWVLARRDGLTACAPGRPGEVLLWFGVAGVASSAAATVDRGAPWIAIGVGAAYRAALHVPLWGSEAVIRCGFALIMAWLFWRLRRIWPLIVGHVLWDIPPVLSQVTPAASVSAAMMWLSQLWCVAGLAAGVCVFLTVRPDPALRVRPLDRG